MLLKNNRNRTYNGIKFNQLIDVKEKDVDSYLEAGFIEVQEKPADKPVSNTNAGKKSKSDTKNNKESEADTDKQDDEPNNETKEEENPNNNQNNVGFNDAKKKTKK